MNNSVPTFETSLPESSLSDPDFDFDFMSQSLFDQIRDAIEI